MTGLYMFGQRIDNINLITFRLSITNGTENINTHTLYTLF